MNSLTLNQLKKARTPVRANLTRTLNTVETNLQNDPIDELALSILQKRLIRTAEELADYDNQVKELLVTNAEVTEDEYTQEVDSIEGYLTKLDEALVKINNILNPREESRSLVSSSHRSSSTESNHTTKVRVKLPKLSIRVFSSEPLDWITWWSHFQPIHEREDISATDKFQYLTAAMKPNTRASDIVNSFPMTATNYSKAIDALQKRFAKPKILKQLYVRELIKLAMKKTKQSGKFDLVQHYDRLETHIRALETLNVTEDQTSAFLYPIVESSLPENTLVAWQRSSLYAEIDSSNKTELTLLMQFLSKEAEAETQRKIVCDGFEPECKKESKSKESNSTKSAQSATTAPSTAAGLLNTNDKSPKCIFCNHPHYTSKCRKSKFILMEEKADLLKKAKACFKCLRPNHRAQDCRMSVECEECKQNTHLRPMCPSYTSTQVSKSVTQSPQPAVNGDKAVKSSTFNTNSQQQKPSTLNASNICRKDVLLKTLIVKAIGSKGFQVVRLLFDDGSQLSNITSELIKKIGAPVISSEWSRNMMFGGSLSEPRYVKSYEVKLQSMDGSFTGTFILRETPAICGIIPRLEVGDWVTDLKEKGIELYDVNSTDIQNPQIVSVQIGSDYWNSLITSAPSTFKNGLAALNTKLGWTVSGPIPNSGNVTTCLNIDAPIALTCFQSSQICQLWELEALGIKPEVDNIDELVKEQFNNTVRRSSDGRYSVALPWNQVPDDLPSNQAVATKRLFNMTKKLTAMSMYSAYDELFIQWEKEKIITKISEEGENVHYLPHRAVYRPQSSTTPIRPVFDASCKVGKSLSLNDCLYKGPNLLDLLPSFLLRFRENRYAFTADIRRAFLMIDVFEPDQEFLRFLWWDKPGVIQVMRHQRLVFGLSCSPYLLNAVLQHHFSHWPIEDDKAVIMLLQKSFYVDNLLGSVPTWEMFLHFQKKAISILDNAKMELREWHKLESTKTESVGILGLKWDNKADSLYLHKPDICTKIISTRRTLSSVLQRIFDPIGFVAPILLLPKLWIQQSWRLTKDWDQPLPTTIVEPCNRWLSELSSIWELRFPRYLHFDEAEVQLHVFCDASKDGYAAVIFARILSEQPYIVFVQARNRLAPIKPMTIPRLELMACWMGTRLLQSTLQGLTTPIKQIYFWSDSTTALAWIAQGNNWSVFVQNRVSEIRKSTPVTATWHYVPTKMNPADLPSRGCYPLQFAASKWWEGPTWLCNLDQWPEENYQANMEAVNVELKHSTIQLFTQPLLNDLWYLPTSSFSKNVRILAYITRFVKRSTQKGPIKGIEYKAAEKWILQRIQYESNLTEANSKVVCIQHNELLCVKTKLLNSSYDIMFKYPILLPSDHPAVEQIIWQEHVQHCHCGYNILAARLRQRFWIIHPRTTIKRILKKCTICRKFTAHSSSAPEGTLPPERVALSRVFQTTGIDLAGPLYCKDGTKVWFVIFTCAIYRAIHLEIVVGLSTAEFLLALRRFICRRGRPSTIFSDNGTNFEGTFNNFSLIDWDEVQTKYATEPIEWKFNPPSAAWWGGFWERLIRIVKDMLKRSLGSKKLELSQLENVMFDVEAIVNCRPLTYIESDTDSLEPLTPSNFLTDVPDLSLPEIDHLSAPKLRKQFKVLCQLRSELKERFLKEYLALLVHRKPTTTTSPDLQVGEVVLIGSEDRRRQLWPLGRIVEFLPGKDGVNRLAKVKTSTGEYLRPIQRLYSLEMRDSIPVPIYVNNSTSIQALADTEALPRTRFGRVIKKPTRYI